MFPLHFHYEDVSRQDPLLKPNHANVMEVPGSCKIRVVPKAAPSDFIIKNGKLAMEIPRGQKLIQKKRASTGKSFRSNPFLGSNKGSVSDLARQSTLRGHGMSNLLFRIGTVLIIMVLMGLLLILFHLYPLLLKKIILWVLGEFIKRFFPFLPPMTLPLIRTLWGIPWGDWTPSLMVFPSGEGTSGTTNPWPSSSQPILEIGSPEISQTTLFQAASPEPAMQDEGVSAPGRGGDLADAVRPFLRAESAQPQTSVNQPAAGPVPPGNAVASTEEAASPARPDPFPYQPDEVIGGDSVLSIQRRLLSQYVFPSAEIIERARIEAEDLFEVKVDIIGRMAPLDPEGDWLGRGARAFDNPRTSTGEESLERLYRLLDDLNQGGVESSAFRSLRGRVFRRRDALDEHSE